MEKLKYFGTDGIRGVFSKEINTLLALKCGNALASLKPGARIAIARDTRPSGSPLLNAFVEGAEDASAEVVDCGILPTAAISHIVLKKKFDFGVVISASHNPHEYNGIKIFGSNGQKLSDELELEIERTIDGYNYVGDGRTRGAKNAVAFYEKHLLKATDVNLNGVRIAIDCANGAAGVVAPDVFRKLGAKVETIAMHGKINDGCGSTCIDAILSHTRRSNADIGFAYDGDADRLVTVLKDGTVVDGDKVLYMLMLYYKKHNMLKGGSVVGTLQTNMAVEREIKREGIEFLRTDVGDRYVIEKMQEVGANLGAEQSGHIIIGDHLPTGDGILASMCISEIFVKDREIFERAARLPLCPQINKNYTVMDRERVLIDPAFIKIKERCEKEIAGVGRVFARASGTEPKVRVTVECEDKALAARISSEFGKFMEGREPIA